MSSQNLPGNKPRITVADGGGTPASPAEAISAGGYVGYRILERCGDCMVNCVKVYVPKYRFVVCVTKGESGVEADFLYDDSCLMHIMFDKGSVPDSEEIADVVSEAIDVYEYILTQKYEKPKEVLL